MNNAFVYARVSTEEQAQEGKSIETQLRLCRKWAVENNYKTIGEYIDEGKSATTLNRPALKDLLADCQNGVKVDTILVQDTDRLARNTLDHLTIKSLLAKKGIKVLSISQPMIDDSPEGNLIDTIIASVNAFQSQLTGRKTSKVLVEKASLGWFPGGTPMLGYKNIDNPAPTATLDKKIIGIDEQVAPYVLKVFETYSTGNSTVAELADFLSKKGFKSPIGYKIHKSYIARMLRSEFYIGKFVWKGKTYIGKHPQFISKDLFAKVQEILTVHNQNGSRKRVHDYLLRGYVFCADCGIRMWAEHHTKPNGAIYDHYYCKGCLTGTYVTIQDLESQVEKEFGKIQLSTSYVDEVLQLAQTMLEESRTNEESDRRKMQGEKNKLEKAMKDAEDSRFISHTITEEVFQRIYNRYDQQLRDLNDEYAGMSIDHSKTLETLEQILRLAENIGKAYKDAEPDLKRYYLGLFYKKFHIKKGKIVKTELSDNLKVPIEEGSIRVSNTGLPRLDSNQ